MLDANVPEVLRRIGPRDRVLDVGGWGRCFNRADAVIDKHPYETRGTAYAERLGLGPQGGASERFDASTWVCRDLCDREPWPFPDQSFDFCTCSHTLEDIRDPLWVCSEMRRVARAGYIECPSPAFELTRGREAFVPVGLSHHFWLVEVRGDAITFLPKLHHLHGDPRLSIPAAVGAALPLDQQVTWLFWEGTFTAKEGWPHREPIEQLVAALTAGAALDDAGPIGAAAERRIFELSRALDEARARLWEASERLAYAEQQWEGTRGMLAVVEQQRDHALAALAAGHPPAAPEPGVRWRLDPAEELGPRAIGIARRLQRLSKQHPRLARLARRLLDDR